MRPNKHIRPTPTSSAIAHRTDSINHVNTELHTLSQAKSEDISGEGAGILPSWRSGVKPEIAVQGFAADPEGCARRSATVAVADGPGFDDLRLLIDTRRRRLLMTFPLEVVLDMVAELFGTERAEELFGDFRPRLTKSEAAGG
jgi:hypothetical protein